MNESINQSINELMNQSINPKFWPLHRSVIEMHINHGQYSRKMTPWKHQHQHQHLTLTLTLTLTLIREVSLQGVLSRRFVQTPIRQNRSSADDRPWSRRRKPWWQVLSWRPFHSSWESQSHCTDQGSTAASREGCWPPPCGRCWNRCSRVPWRWRRCRERSRRISGTTVSAVLSVAARQQQKLHIVSLWDKRQRRIENRLCTIIPNSTAWDS